MARIHVTVPDELHDDIEELVENNKYLTSKSELVRVALKRHFEKDRR